MERWLPKFQPVLGSGGQFVVVASVPPSRAVARFGGRRPGRFCQTRRRDGGRYNPMGGTANCSYPMAVSKPSHYPIFRPVTLDSLVSLVKTVKMTEVTVLTKMTG